MKKGPGREAFAEIKKLDPLVIEEIDRRLTDGDSCAKVGHWLQTDQKAFAGMKADSLKKMLERYRGKEIREKMYGEKYEAKSKSYLQEARGAAMIEYRCADGRETAGAQRTPNDECQSRSR